MYILLEKQKYFACWLKIPVHSLCSVPSAFAGTTIGRNVIGNGGLHPPYGCWIPIDTGMEIIDDFPEDN
jgi:hypothetical protein